MSNDTAFASDGTEVDSSYDAGLFGSDLAGYTEAERQVGSTPIPRFEKYILQLVGGEGVENENGPNYARIRLKVLEGPEGTAGREFFSNIFFHINPVRTKKDGSKVARTEEEKGKAKKNLGDTLLRVKRVMGFTTATPAKGDKETITAWIGGAVEAAQPFVGEIRIEAGNPEKGYAPRNSMPLQSIAAPGDSVKDEKGNVIAGKTAGQDAKDKIAAFNKNKAKASGTTAKSHGPAKPSNF